MITDEAVSLQDHRRGWAMVTFTFGPLLLPVEIVAKLNIRPGTPVDAHAVLGEAMVHQTADARRYTNRYLALSERSSGQLRRKLQDRGYLPKVVNQTVAWAKEYGLIDDLRYARAFASGRMLGRQGLIAQLRHRGVDDSAVSALLSELPEGDSIDSLVSIVRKKYGSISDSRAARRRAAGWLSRRGYSSGIVARVLEKAL
jgi:regulatory protein